MLGNFTQQTTSADDIFIMLFFLGALRVKAGIDKMFFRIANREELDQTDLSDDGSVFPSLFGRQLEFQILEHLP